MSRTRRALLVLLVVFAALLGSAGVAHASALVTGPGYDSVETAIANGNYDDGASDAIALPFWLNYFGVPRAQAWMGTNGYVTFDGPYMNWSASSPLNSYGEPMVAGLFTDLYDGRYLGGAATMSYGQTEWHSLSVATFNWTGHPHLYDSSPHTFQAAFVDRSDVAAGDFDLMLNYETIPPGIADHVYERAGSANGIGSGFELPGSGAAGPFHDGQPTGLVNNGTSPDVLGRYYYVSRGGVMWEDTSTPVTDDDVPSPSPVYWLEATVTVTATDTGSGVYETWTSLDGGAWTTATVLSTSAIGEHTLSYYSVDHAANREETETVTFYVADTSPYVVPDERWAVEDGGFQWLPPSLFANDFDLEGDPLSFPNGFMGDVDPLTWNWTSLQLELALGDFRYEPNADFYGTELFRYRATDTTSYSTNWALVTVHVLPVNDPPSFVEMTATVTVAEDSGPWSGAYAGSISPGPANEATQSLTMATTNTAPALFSQQPTVALNGMLSFTPAPNASGAATVTVTLTDDDTQGGPALSRTDTMTIVITPVNDPPDPSPDFYTTPEDTTLTVPPRSVLDNDTDPDAGDTLSLAGYTPATFGTLLVHGDWFDYVPDPDAFGVEVLRYVVEDALGASAEETFTITVVPVNDEPTFTATTDTVPWDEDAGSFSTTYAIDIDAGAANEATQQLTFATVNSDPAAFSQQPTVAPDGVLHFTPSQVGGSALVTVTLTDDGTQGGPALSHVHTLTIDIAQSNDPPVTVPDTYTIAEDTSLTVAAPGLVGNDYDPDGTTVTAIFDNTVGPYHFSAFGYSSDGSFSYTPEADYNGTDWFTYWAIDPDVGESVRTTGTATITITPVNDAPSFAEATSAITVPEDWGYFGTQYSTDATAGAPNEASQVLTYTLDVSDPSLFDYVQIEPDGWLEFYTAANAFGSAEVTVTLWDDATAGGPALSHVETLTITIVSVNDVPVAGDDAYSVAEDGILYVPPMGVLTDDTDADGDPLTSLLSGAPGNGTAALMPDGSFLYVPDADFSGVDTFWYTAWDGAAASAPAAVDITVTPVNDSPVIDQSSPATATCAEDGSVQIALSATDPDGDPLSWVVVSGPTDGAATVTPAGDSVAATYTPDADFNGADAFAVSVSDGNGGTDLIVVEVTVTPVNDAPVAMPDEYTFAEDTTLTLLAPGFLGNDFDVDGDAIYLDFGASTLFPPEAGYGFVNWTGPYLLLTTEDFNGTTYATYGATDLIVTSALTTVTFNVTPVNDPPSFASGGDVVWPEDGGAYTAGWATGLDTGAANEFQTLTFSTANDSPALFTGQPDVAADGSLAFEPAPDANGSALVTVTITDDDTAGGPALSTDVTFTITITPVNDPPVTSEDTFSTAEDTTLTVAVPGVLAGDSDIDGGPLSVGLVTDVSHGSLSLQADGSFTYLPAQDFFGTDLFRYEAGDGLGGFSPATTVTIEVTPVNDAPVAMGDAYSTKEDEQLSVPAPGVLADDTDVESDTLSAQIVTGATHGTAHVYGDGAVLYTPDPGYVGPDAFTYRAYDGADHSAPVTVTVDVTDVVVAYTEIAGSTRIDTAVEAAAAAYPSGAATVLIANGYNWPDALGGAALAGAVDGPILLTPAEDVPPAVMQAIADLGATDAIVLGGTRAVSAAAFAEIETALGAGNVRRIGGATRYDTAAMVASETVALLGGGYDGTAFLASGVNFPDPLAASPVSNAKGWPVYLASAGGAVSAETSAAMTAAGVGHVVILGGTGAVSAATEADLVTASYTVERLAGHDRYWTAKAVAEWACAFHGMVWDGVAVATGQKPADALAGGVLAGRGNTVMLLTPSDSLHPAASGSLALHRTEIEAVTYLGGPNAVSQPVRDAVAALLR